jgi:NRPS condensation-like uncharacterized protein
MTSEKENHIPDFEMEMSFERAIPLGSGVYIKMVAYVFENITPDAFKAAVHKLALKHPLLRSRIEKRQIENKEKYFFTTTGGMFPICKIVDGLSEELIVSTILNENLTCGAFDGTLSTSRFILLKGQKQSAIIAYIHHCVADGRAVAFILKHLLEFIANPMKLIEPLTPITMLNHLPSDVKIAGFVKSMVNLLNKKWLKEKKEFSAQDIAQVSQERAKKSPDLYVKEKLSQKETQRLRETARRNNVSVNSALMASILMTETQVDETKDFVGGIGFAIDIRDRLTSKAGESCALLASGATIKGKYQEGLSFWDFARVMEDKAKKAMKSNKKIFMRRVLSSYMEPSLIEAQFMLANGNWEGTPMLKKMKGRMKKLPVQAMITNLGGLTLPLSYNDSKGVPQIHLDDAEFIMPVQIKNVITVAAASLAGKLTIVLPAGPADFDPNAQRKIAEKIVENLRNAIQ